MAVASCVPKSARSQAERRYPVICDAGEQAFVVLVTLPAPPQPGWRFAARGQLWEVVRAGDLTRGPVARPLRTARP